MEPLISLCLPVYNGGGFIEPTLSSVLAQTYSNWELIIVDDGSTDGTAAALADWVANLRDSRVRYLTNATRLGMVGNWNRATGLARGEFVKLLGQDDLLTPDCLEAQSRILTEYPQVSLVACARQVVSASGKPIMVRRGFPHEGSYDGVATIRKCLRKGTNIIGEPVGVLFRASTLGLRDLFEPAITYCTDVDLWLRLLAHGDLYFMATPRSSYRIHQHAATRELENQIVDDFFRLVERCEQAGYVQFSAADRKWLRLKVHALAVARRFFYNFLA